MVLIIYNENASNLTKRNRDMVPGGQKMQMDVQPGRRKDAQINPELHPSNFPGG